MIFLFFVFDLQMLDLVQANGDSDDSNEVCDSVDKLRVELGFVLKRHIIVTITVLFFSPNVLTSFLSVPSSPKKSDKFSIAMKMATVPAKSP